MDEKKSSFWKFAVVFVVLIVLALGAVVAARLYEKWQGEQAVQKFAEAMKKAEEDAYRAAMADTYGGKTPQETLQMYIDAVEKGDYVLASKYFIGDNQEKELGRLQNWSKENINNIVNLLKQDINSVGSYSDKKDEFVIDRPTTVDFRLYPNGTWKIIEI
jgi:flagellar biosynthesis/type III secretory pathway M-ring protein FliF/YscJ